MGRRLNRACSNEGTFAMGSLKALTLAGGVALLATTAARAADLPPPPPPEPVPMAAPAAEFNGWYLRGDVGVGASQATKLRQSFDAGFSVAGLHVDSEKRGDQSFAGVGVGYKLNNWVRFDATGEYRSAADWKAVASYTSFCTLASGRCYDNYNGRLSNAVFLANAYADLGNWSGVTPFVGLGVGTARHRFTSLTDADYQLGGYGLAKDRTTWRLAWAVMAGLSYDVSSNLKLELGYRYLNMGKASSAAISCLNAGSCGHEVQRINVASHDIRLGMRWMLGGEPAAPAQGGYFPTLVRSKY
jgi:opacity protein-like surface antigen